MPCCSWREPHRRVLSAASLPSSRVGEAGVRAAALSTGWEGAQGKPRAGLPGERDFNRPIRVLLGKEVAGAALWGGLRKHGGRTKPGSRKVGVRAWGRGGGSAWSSRMSWGHSGDQFWGHCMPWVAHGDARLRFLSGRWAGS